MNLRGTINSHPKTLNPKPNPKPKPLNPKPPNALQQAACLMPANQIDGKLRQESRSRYHKGRHPRLSGGFRVEGLRLFRVQGSGFRVQGLGFEAI